MLNERNKSLCWRVLAKYGCEHHLKMVIEEKKKKKKAVCKIHRDDGHITEAHDENLREELVDVLVVCQQMFLALKMDEEDINRRARSKLERALQ